MKSLGEIREIKSHLKELLWKEITARQTLVEQVFSSCPKDVALGIIERVKNGQDPMPLVSEFIRFEKEKNDPGFGKVIWVD
ncbi:MAG: hypothetical protein KAQ98_09410 [Bacteriovoracaceae bacterium]|nr:hypothetical protein [Bacteriovoracaceae bacterium]